MGEAKRKAAALDAGRPWPRRRVCPVKRCRSARVIDLPETDPLCIEYAGFWKNRNVVCLRICRDCMAVWEPWPDDAPEDCVERARSHGPCDNCAYRAGSAEMADPVEREKMLAMARNASESGSGQFCCHKGIKIRVTKAEGIAFDYEACGVNPRSQSCTGFLLAMWAEQKKRRSA